MVTPTKDELYAKALEIFMQEMYAKGMTDVRTPEYEELAEGNYVERARIELMKAPETRAWEEELKSLESAISQLEEARQREAEGVPAGVEVAPETLRKLLEIYNDLKMREDQLRDLRSKRKEETKAAKEHISELESQMAKAREEAQKKPALKIRILQNFKEGIQYFRKGDVIETHNIDWALAKIDQKLAERVGVEVPIKIVPAAPPTVIKPEAPKDRVRFLTDRFYEYLRVNDVPVTDVHRRAWRVRLEDVILQAREEEQLRLMEEFAQTLVDEYKRKVAERVRRRLEAPPEERLPLGWKMVKGGYLVNGRFIPWEEWEAGRVRVEEEWVGPHVLRLEEYVRDVLHMSMQEFEAKPLAEIEKVVKEYQEYIKRHYGEQYGGVS
jgi:hypothetical protein